MTEAEASIRAALEAHTTESGLVDSPSFRDACSPSNITALLAELDKTREDLLTWSRACRNAKGIADSALAQSTTKAPAPQRNMETDRHEDDTDNWW